MSKWHPGLELASRIVRIDLQIISWNLETLLDILLGSSAGDSGLLNDDLGRGSDLSDSSGSELKEPIKMSACK